MVVVRGVYVSYGWAAVDGEGGGVGVEGEDEEEDVERDWSWEVRACWERALVK